MISPVVTTSPAELRARSIAAFFATYARTCRCATETDLREERTGELECLCSAPIVRKEARS